MLVASAYNQPVTYWGAPVQDGYGAWTFSAPQLINVRWEDSTEEYLDMQGNERVSKAIVWIPDGVDPDIGGYLIKGDMTGHASPADIPNAMPIQRVDEIPDLRGLNSEVRAYL